MSNSRASIVGFLWNHNPFYVISALLMLYGVRVSYGKLEIGTINCWAMMGVLAGYTVLLAAIGTAIVRWGKVWDDARSILLVLLLLFLGISISADDLFVNMESSRGGALLMLGGFGFSVAVLWGVLRATRIHLQWVYFFPLTMFLGLFFVAPWWCSPELHPKNNLSLDRTVFYFPQIAAMLTLFLIPAVRMGQKSVEGNGTPWPWPLFPWSAFVFVGVAVVLRSYSLTMTYSQTGPIWASPEFRSGIVFDTIWRPYFLVPLAFAILVLLLEAGIATQNRMLTRRALNLAPLTLVMAWPVFPTQTMFNFLNPLTETVGSPLWLTVWMLIVFFGFAGVRKVGGALERLSICLLLLSVVGPKTISFDTFTEPTSFPFWILATVIGVLSLLQRSAVPALVASVASTIGLWLSLPTTLAQDFRVGLCVHLMTAACIVIGLFWQDSLAKLLQRVGVFLLVVLAVGMASDRARFVFPLEGRVAYGMAIALIALVCAHFARMRSYWTAFVIAIGGMGYEVTVEMYRAAAANFGRDAVIALFWSFGTLLTGVLISAYKAGWLPHISPKSLGLDPWWHSHIDKSQVQFAQPSPPANPPAES